MPIVIASRLSVLLVLAGLAGLWGCESEAQRKKINELSTQVRRLDEMSMALERQVTTLTGENQELREKLAAAEARGAPAKRK